MRRAAGPLLVAAALALLGYRFLDIDLAFFARDEPQFLAAAREQVRTGHWLSANPLYGNLGLRYGPSSFWFYGVVQLLFGDGARTAIVAMGLLVTLSQVALALALRRVFDLDAVAFGILLAWVAASPYQFFWSRMAWDLTSSAGAFLAVALLASFREWAPWPVAALGLVLGLALSTHPSVVPLAVAVGCVLLWELRTRPRLLVARGTLLLAVVAAVSVPYLRFLLHAPVGRRTPPHVLSLDEWRLLVLQVPRVFSAWGLDEYFEKPWPDFQAWLGRGPSLALGTLAVASLLVCFSAALAGVALAFRSADVRYRRLALTAVLSWGGTVLLLGLLGLDRHPHYHFSCAWVAVFGMAACLSTLRRGGGRRRAVAMACLGALVAAQFTVIVAWMGYVRARSGLRTAAHGTAIGLQVQAVREVCALPGTSIVLRNETEMYPWPFEYLADTEPGCRGKRVFACSAIPPRWTKPCPSPLPPDARLVRLRYAGAEGGALRVVE